MTSLETLQRALADRYTFDREIGSGGMATVYLAQDLKHGRDVAVKVLKPELGAVLGAERFLSEIRVTANLQHPNLLPLFDSGEAEGLLFYVMPFVRGETLRARIDREKQLPIEEAVRIAVAIASALGYAHEHGVIHRDLKPENILIQSGQPVIADFGIALAVSKAGGARVTQTGLSLGTPQYMSPEQAAGDRVIDARSDIYSLGAVTYEMFAGEPPHSGTSAQAIIAKLMTSEPRPLHTLRSTVPVHVACAVEKALAKLPADRFATANDFVAALQNPSFTIPSRTGIAPLRDMAAVKSWKKISFVTAAFAVLMTAVAMWALARPAQSRTVLRYTLAFDSAQAIGGPRARIAISPDGSHIVYTGGAQQHLYVRRRDELVARLLPGTENAMNPAFSPDGRKIVFNTTTGLRVVSIQGAPPVLITDSLIGNGGQSWGRDGFLYVDGVGSAPLVRVAPEPGAPPKVFTALDTASGEVNHNWPDALPNGKGVLFTAHYGGKNRSGSAIAVAETKSGRHLSILPGATLARYSRSGHIVYVTADGTLMAVPFDQNSLKISGEAIAIVDRLRVGNGSDVTLSDNGTLIYATGGQQTGRELVWVTRDGTAERVDSTWFGNFWDPAISPDGKRVAVVDESSTRSDIWIKQLDRGPSLKLTVDGIYNGYPSWSPDGRSVTFFSDVGGKRELWTQRADGSAKPALQLRMETDLAESAWSPDGRWLVFRSRTTGTSQGDIFGVRPGVDSAPVALVSTRRSDVA
ncbi:MAG: protein kinase, partial [Gemmatimonadaceae bacterium]